MRSLLVNFFHLLTEPWRLEVQRSMPPPAESSREAIQTLFPEISPENVNACLIEYLSNEKFFSELNKKYIQKRMKRFQGGEWYGFLYLAVRLNKPRIIIETGVFDGCSSAVILQALEDNDFGELVSVDLPAREAIKKSTNWMPENSLPPDCQPGWAIPDYLKQRFHLILGDCKDILSSVIDEYPRMDIFIHDSLHTFEHQLFEYKIAWPNLQDDGLLISDDIFWSAAFHQFCKQISKPYVYVGGFNTGGFGAVKK